MCKLERQHFLISTQVKKRCEALYLYVHLNETVEAAEEYDTQKLLKQAAFLSAQCAPFEVEDSD